MPSYKLTYFDVRARAELIRYVFAAAGKEFENCRLEREQWPSVKPTTPFGQVPLLEVDGKPLAQGHAIARFLAREFGLAGENSWEEALCDQYIGLGEDLFMEIVKVFFEQDENKKTEISNKLREETIPKFMGLFEKALEANGGTYFVGNKLSIADLACVAVFDTPIGRHPELMDKFAKLKAHRAQVLALPNISNYVKTRKQTDL